MNWLNRLFSNEPSAEQNERQIEMITAKVMDKARLAAIESSRDQFKVVTTKLGELAKENTVLRKSVVELSTLSRHLALTVQNLSSSVDNSVRRMEGLHLNVSQERAHIATALNTMNKRINDNFPEGRSPDSTALVAPLSNHPVTNPERKAPAP